MLIFLNLFNPELHLKDTIDLLTGLRGFKFVTPLVLEFTKIESDSSTKYSTFYLNSKAETIINESNIDEVFESIHSLIIPNMQKSL